MVGVSISIDNHNLFQAKPSLHLQESYKLLHVHASLSLPVRAIVAVVVQQGCPVQRTVNAKVTITVLMTAQFTTEITLMKTNNTVKVVIEEFM